jgi:hypothetical protein
VRRRFVPPSLPELVSQSQNQRCVNDPGVLPCRWPQNAATGSFTPALVVSPVVVVRAQHVPDERAARVHMIVSKFAGTKQSVIHSQIGFAQVAIFPGRTSHAVSRISRLTPSRL